MIFWEYEFRIREQDPLKQGLKLTRYEPAVYASPEIREQDPLKQGLKPCSGLQFEFAIHGFVSKIH